MGRGLLPIYREVARSAGGAAPVGLSAALSPGAVQASCRVTLQVRRDELVPGLAYGHGHAFALVDQPRDLCAIDLDPGHVAVMTYTHLADTQRLECGLRRFDPAQRCHGDQHPVRDAR